MLLSLRSEAIGGIIWTSLNRFGTQLVVFLVSVVLARVLSPEEFGLIAMITVFNSLGGLLTDAGLCQSLIRTKDVDDKDYSTVFYFNFAGSIIIYLIIFLCAPLVAIFFDQPILTSLLRIYAISFVVNAFSNVQVTILTRELNFKRQFYITFPSLILGSAVGIYSAYTGAGVWSLVYSQLVQSVLNTTLYFLLSDWKPSFSFNKESFNKHFNYGYKLTLSGILDMLFNNIYYVIIGRFYSPAQVGFFNRADTFKQFPVNSISSVLNKVTFPLFAKIQSDDDRLKAAYRKVLKLITFLIAPLLAFMAILANDIFVFLFTEKWRPAAPYFQILFINGIFYPLHVYNLNLLKVKGRSDLFLKLEVFKKIIVIAVILSVFTFGIYGLLLGSVFISIVSFFLNAYYTSKFLAYSAFDQLKDLLPILFLTSCSAGVVYLVHKLLEGVNTSLVLGLILSMLSGLFIYVTFSFLFEKEMIKEIKNLIKGK